MKSKEEILVSLIRANPNMVSEGGAVHVDLMMEMMEEYASQQSDEMAIEFAEWIYENGFRKVLSSFSREERKWRKLKENISYTTNELLIKFKEGR